MQDLRLITLALVLGLLACGCEKKEPPTEDVERFLAKLRFDSRGKLKDFPLDVVK